MKVESIIEVSAAAHTTAYVDSKAPERGGFMFVGPPASLKTAIAETLDCFSSAMILSDITIMQASRLRDDMIGGKLHTLVFSDVAKLYARHSAVASNIEGFIRGIAGEGFRKPNWEDSRAISIPARALTVGCMTWNFYNKKYGQWVDDGLARRFLWCHFHLQNPDLIFNALSLGKRLDFVPNGLNTKIPSSMIPENVSIREREELRNMIRHQPGREVGITVMRKLLSALKWRLKSSSRAMAVLRDFSECLGKEGAVLQVPEKYL